MPFQLSPGVNVVEKDFTSIVPAVSSSVGAFAGAFRWGPIEEPTRVSSENELVKLFGAPKPEDTTVAQAFFTAANFLSYTNNLLVARADTANSRNAVALASGGISSSEVRLLSAGTGYSAQQFKVNLDGAGGSGAVLIVNSNVIGNTRYFTNVTDASGAPVDPVVISSPGTSYNAGDYNIVLFDTNGTPDGADVVKVNIQTNALSGGISSATIVTANNAPTTYPVTAGQLSVVFSTPEISGGQLPTANARAFDSGTNRTITGITVLTAGSGYTAGPSFVVEQTGATIIDANKANGVVNAITATSLGVKIKNLSHYEDNYANGGNAVGQFAARYAGLNGNGLRVVVIDSSTWADTDASLRGAFTSAPGTSGYAASKGIDDDEMHILVLDSQEGTFSGVPSVLRPVILEKYEFVSKLSDARKSDGSSNYYKTVINTNSQYVWWMDHPYFNQVSNPRSDGAPLVDVVASSVLTITSNTVSVTSTDLQVTEPLNDFLAFLASSRDAVTGSTGRQIRLENTTLNNKVVEVLSAVKDENTYTFTVAAESFASEVTGSSAKIVSVSKHTWGSGSDAIIGSANARKMALLSSTLDFTLAGGALDTNPTEGNVQDAFAPFANTEQYDISLIPLGNVSATTAKWVEDNVVEVRKDCMVFLSPNASGNPITSTGSTALNAIKAYRDATNINSSYAVIDSGFKYQYDRYNDIYRWVPLNGDIAGLCARTDFTAEPWFSPGGFNRGVVKNIVKLAFNPTQAERDVLYAAGVNPVVSFPGQGVILFGDKTMLTKPSAFDRINVRRLFIVLEKAIATAARFQLFEFNDDFTRAQFKNAVEPFLRDVQGRRGVVDFRVKCDTTNNTGEVIDRNEFVADIFIKPNRAINFITLNFIAARSAVNFEEIGA
jgi:phage tail sheath protein FI